MQRTLWLLLAMLLTPGFAADLIIAEGKKCPYQIVVPDAENEFNTFYRQTAEMLQRCVRRAAGCGVPIVKESARTAGKPAIFIGKSPDGKMPEGLWEHRIEVRRGDIYLYGNDANPTGTTNKGFPRYVLGTVKAAAMFAEQFLNTRFTYPDWHGVSTLPREEITVPDDFKFAGISKIQYVSGRPRELFYDAANHFYSAPWYGNYGGHSHDKAIPREKYFKEHPEYFALIKGKRGGGYRGLQYCFSNPAVRELIYGELLTHADRGYDMVQLGQSDGFGGCECDDCKKLFDVSDWGEKLWILHNQFAERFQKDRPGKKLCIMAYGPTVKPPKTFQDFPDNVVIELAPYSKENMMEWRKYTVQNGFVTYLYNWGFYNVEGFMPKRSLKFLQEQVKDFLADGICGIYRCGFGENFGLEGPQYYAWGKWLSNPDAAPEQLLNEYCTFTFGNAAGTMEKFYKLLDLRLEQSSVEFGGEDNIYADWNDPALLEGRKPAMYLPLRTIALRYPPEVVAELETLLTRAEKEFGNVAEREKYLLLLIRLEFDYLKITAAGVDAFQKFRSEPTDENNVHLLAAIAARNEFIDKLPLTKDIPPRIAPFGNLLSFGHATKAEVEDGGRLSAPLLAPFTWNVKWLQENNIKPTGRIIKSGESQLLLQRNFYRWKPEITEKPVSIQVKYDEENLYATFTFVNTSPAEIAKQLTAVFIGNGKERYRLNGRVTGNSGIARYIRTQTNAENNGGGDQYERKGDAGNVSVEENAATLTIPWSELNIKPEKGLKLEFNVTHTRADGELRYGWNYNPFQRTWRNLDDVTGILEL